MEKSNFCYIKDIVFNDVRKIERIQVLSQNQILIKHTGRYSDFYEVINTIDILSDTEYKRLKGNKRKESKKLLLDFMQLRNIDIKEAIEILKEGEKYGK